MNFDDIISGISTLLKGFNFDLNLDFGKIKNVIDAITAFFPAK